MATNAKTNVWFVLVVKRYFGQSVSQYLPLFLLSASTDKLFCLANVLEAGLLFWQRLTAWSSFSSSLLYVHTGRGESVKVAGSHSFSMRASGESGAARFGRWERRGELKSAQLYGNELWRGWAATNQNVEVLHLRGLQRTQPVNFGSDHISSQAKWRRS